MLVVTLIGLAAIASLFAGVYTDHRQICRRRRREIHTAVVTAVHRQDFEESIKAMGGSGGRR